MLSVLGNVSAKSGNMMIADEPIEGDIEVHDISFIVGAGGEHIIYNASFIYVEGNGIFGDVSVTGTEGITFFLSNETGYNTWEDEGHAGAAFYSFTNITTSDISFRIFVTGPMYIVFDNRKESDEVTIDFRLYIDKSGPDVTETDIEVDMVYFGDMNFSISIRDAHFILGYTEVSFDGKVYSSSDEYNPMHIHKLEWASANFDDGAHIWEVYMEDEFGNNRTVTYRVYTDNHPDLTTNGPSGVNWFGVATMVGLFCVIGIPAGLIMRELAKMMRVRE